jgi:hypothetical protein
MCDDIQLCNCHVCEFLILAHTWFVFGLPSKTGCDNDARGNSQKIHKRTHDGEGARYVDDIANGPLPLYEPHAIVHKATNSKEALPIKVAQVEAIGLNVTPGFKG